MNVAIPIPDTSTTSGSGVMPIPANGVDAAPAKKPRKARESQYDRYVVQLHKSSQVSLDELPGQLRNLAAETGEELIEKPTFGGTIFTIKPRTASDAKAQERLQAQVDKLKALAEKLGADPASLLS